MIQIVFGQLHACANIDYNLTPLFINKESEFGDFGFEKKNLKKN